MMRRVLVVGGVGRVGQRPGHCGERLQRGVWAVQAGAPPVVLLGAEQGVGQAVHGGDLQAPPQPALQTLAITRLLL